jgi:hypothetical protein
MAAISINDSLRTLAEKALLMDSLFRDESESRTLRDDIAAHCLTLKSIRILKSALVLMDSKDSLHSYIAGSKLTFPSLKPPAEEVTVMTAKTCFQQNKLITSQQQISQLQWDSFLSFSFRL